MEIFGECDVCGYTVEEEIRSNAQSDVKTNRKNWSCV